MIGSILKIEENVVTIKLVNNEDTQVIPLNFHVIFEDQISKIVGKISSATQTEVIVDIVGEIANGQFSSGTLARPSFSSVVRLITIEELALMYGSQILMHGYSNFGTSNVYKNYKINVSINEFFSNHFAILGNSGSGKSCTVASLFQKMFRQDNAPVNSHILFIDTFGEYTSAFQGMGNSTGNINYQCLTTNREDGTARLFAIPFWLLTVDDIALLLNATSKAQLSVISKALDLVKILTSESESVINRKNDIIARALINIMVSGVAPIEMHDQVTAILTKFNTPLLNLETEIYQPGYTLTIKQCLNIDQNGKIQALELLMSFLNEYMVTEEDVEIEANDCYSISDLESAIELALVSSGVLNSKKAFDELNQLSVNIHSLANSDRAQYFEYPVKVTREEYIQSLFLTLSGAPCQLVSLNMNGVDDRFACVMIKTLSNMFFQIQGNALNRGQSAYHLIIEEAHRYIRNDDTDDEVIGYNIFDRIAKEGRKYGLFLGLITQRPSELSDTCISQCSNFVVLRVLHPKDLAYIKDMVPSMTSDIATQLKNLKPGNCICFGNAFKVPISLYVDLPNPMPSSQNVNLSNVWY